MKNKIWIPVLLIPFILLSACDGNSKQSAGQQDTVRTVLTDSPQVNKAVELPGLSTETYVAGIISRQQAIRNQLPGDNTEKNALLYRSLALYVDTALVGISANEAVWLDKYVNYYSEEKGKTVAPANVQQRVDLLATAGIEPWGVGEGYTELRMVPTFYTTLFKTSLPADYTAYLQLQADEDTVLYSADAGLMVPFSLVGQRALNWEKFLTAYPNSIFAAIARDLYERYCDEYLFGEDNTASFDKRGDLSSLLPENKEEYLSFVQQHGDTKTGGIVKLFLDKLSTEKSYDDLIQHMRTAIGAVFGGSVSLSGPQPDFGAEAIEKLTKSVYDTVSGEVEIAAGTTDKIDRGLDSIMYFQQDNNVYCVALFTNTGRGGGAPVSGWVDVWAFKKTGSGWQTVSYLLNAGGGGMYGNSGYFDKLIKMGNHTIGIIISGGITHMGSSVSWDNLIAFKEGKLFPAMNIVTNDAYDNGSGTQHCRVNNWWLLHTAQQENYDMVIIPGSCIGGNQPLDRIIVPFKNGRYNIPSELQDKGI